MTGVEAASSTLGSCGLAELRRVTPTTGAGLATDSVLRAEEGVGVSSSSSGREVPWIATGAGVSAALMKSSEVALSEVGAEAVRSDWVDRAGAVESMARRVW
jgi:hypothetical protein